MASWSTKPIPMEIAFPIFLRRIQAGETPIPTIEAIVLVDGSHDDDTQAIQSAIDEVAKRKPNESGFRGAVLLPPGKLKVQGTLRIHASGIVLRGCGAKDSGTTLLATGFDRRSLIEVVGGRMETIGDPISVADRHLPSNTMKLSVPPSHSIHAGDLSESRSHVPKSGSKLLV